MRTLSADFDSWTPHEQAAVVWNALHSRRTKLESVLGRQLPDDLRMHNVPLVWIGEKTEATNHVFDRSDPELNAVVFGKRLNEWLEKQRPIDGRDLLLQIRAQLREADELIVALRRSGQLQDHVEELQRVACREGWTANDMTMAGKSVLYGSQKSPGSQPRPQWQCEEHARKLASLANLLVDLIVESRIVELETNRQADVSPPLPDDSTADGKSRAKVKSGRQPGSVPSAADFAVTNQSANDTQAGSQLSTQALEQILKGDMHTICGEANVIYRDLSKADYGIDGELEFRDNDGNASGHKVYVQLKSGDSHLRLRQVDRKLIFDVRNPRHLDYWQKQPCDVWLVIRDGQGTILWMNITQYLRDRPNKTCLQIEFDGSRLTASAIRLLGEAAIPPSNR